MENNKVKGVHECLKTGGYFAFECYDKDGNLKWQENVFNLYPSEGLDYILGVIFKNATRSDPLYVGLNETNNPTSSWTMANNGSTWDEFVGYRESTRQEFVDGNISSNELDNSASKATFSINASGTIYGGFLSTDSTKDGTSGALVCSGNFTGGSRSVQSGDTVNVTYTVGASN